MNLFESAAAELGAVTERHATHRETSVKAFAAAPRAARESILQHLCERPRTCDEIMALGYTHQTASATINNLMRSGHISDSGERRRTVANRSAIVWSVNAVPRPITDARPTRAQLADRIDAAIAACNSGSTHAEILQILTGCNAQ